MEMIKSRKLNIIYTFAFAVFINISSCCIFETDTADLRIVGQSFPSQVNNGQRFSLDFTVGNYSNGDCSAETTTQSIVNLKMIKRDTQVLQVNNTETLNGLENDQTQVFNFSVLIEGAGADGIYDLIFTVDPNNTSGAGYRENDVYTSTVTVVN